MCFRSTQSQVFSHVTIHIFVSCDPSLTEEVEAAKLELERQRRILAQESERKRQERELAVCLASLVACILAQSYCVVFENFKLLRANDTTEAVAANYKNKIFLETNSTVFNFLVLFNGNNFN